MTTVLVNETLDKLAKGESGLYTDKPIMSFMIYALIDAYLDKRLSEKDFLNDLKATLT